jgi:hypothetical protein
MVAMRVVNGIEREMVQSEWENWLVNEKMLCDDLELVLRGYDKDKSGKKGDLQRQKDMGSSLTGNRRRVLEQWRDGYCGSCRRDFEAVIKERAATGM